MAPDQSLFILYDFIIFLAWLPSFLAYRLAKIRLIKLINFSPQRLKVLNSFLSLLRLPLFCAT